VSENGETSSHGKTGFRADRIPELPESPKKRERLGEDLQPVGDYAGIEPYYRVCEDVGAVQHQDQTDPDDFASGEWWWDHRQIRFLSGKAFIGLSALLLLVPYVWGGVVLVGGGVATVYYLLVITTDTAYFLRVLVILFAVFIWMPVSFYTLIKTMPWVMGGFALLLRPFDKLLSKLLDRGLKSGESDFNRQTGHVSFLLPGGRRLTAPFVEFDAYVERVIQQGGIF